VKKKSEKTAGKVYFLRTNSTYPESPSPFFAQGPSTWPKNNDFHWASFFITYKAGTLESHSTSALHIDSPPEEPHIFPCGPINFPEPLTPSSIHKALSQTPSPECQRPRRRIPPT
jgi:hypothetical protein